MKLIISQDGVKRELCTPFKLCMAPDDMARLGRHLIGLSAAMKEEGTSYGTVNVYPDCSLGGPANTPPRNWTE